MFHKPAEPVLRVRHWWDLFAFLEVKFGIEQGFAESFKNRHAVVADIAVVLSAPSGPKVAPQFIDLGVDPGPSRTRMARDPLRQG